MQNSSILIVPGLRDHVADHWQTYLQAEHPKAFSVPPLTSDRLSLAARVEAISRALDRIDGPVILVAHSAGVIMVAHWAQAATHPIQGALLAAPPDLETPLPVGYPTMPDLHAGGWLPVPRSRLPFPSLVGVSENDPLASLDRATSLAGDWGAEVVNLGQVGHLNPASGFGHWPDAHRLIAHLQNSTT